MTESTKYGIVTQQNTIQPLKNKGLLRHVAALGEPPKHDAK
jgi:hypothetical protein